LSEVEVLVRRHTERAVLVSLEDMDRWVPYSLIDESSAVTAGTPVNTVALLVLPEWKAVELGFE